MEKFTVTGKVVDIVNRKIFSGSITVENGKIISIKPSEDISGNQYILPGFIDSHVHVESSMLIPSEFARLAVTHGTVATISDPHEIGNVLGIEGVRYMIQNGNQVPFHFYFGAPSCVPATPFETAGATISANEIRTLFEHDGLIYLSEMMNYPGVLARDELVMDKIAIAKALKLPVDGHSPGLKGEDAKRYISAGITTDHECYSLEEALDKLKFGMHIIIREGSAAKNYEALHSIIGTHPEKVMFCSDDKHPDDLVEGHINQMVKRSIIDHGFDTMDVLRCASFNPVKHYNLDVGLLQEGDPADFIVVDNLHDFSVKQTFIKGRLVGENGKTLIGSVDSEIVNQFNTSPKNAGDFALKSEGDTIQVIKALDGELITEKMQAKAKIIDNYYVSDPKQDVLKLAVVNRYQEAPVAVAFINGFKLKSGAFASCIAHDSHNIIAVGVTDDDLCQAVNAIIENKGGISVANNDKVDVLPLPVGGIMSHDDGYTVAENYSKLSQQVKQLGSTFHSPFMTLSFMALLVIPSLKLSDKGLFDGSSFKFTPLTVNP